MHKTTFALSLSLCAAVLSGCGDALDDEEINTSSDAIEGTSDTNALIAASLDSAQTAMTPEAAATLSATSASTYYQPAGCVVATPSGASVSYQFTNCRGPYGLVGLNGTLTARYVSRTAAGWTVNVSGELQANRATLRPNANATVSTAGTTRTAMVTLMGGGTGPRGVTYTNRGSYTSTWDGTCYGITGSVTSTSSAGAVTFAASNYRRCRGACPDAGGSLAVSGAGGASLTITYSGGATASVAASSGRTSTVRLFCGGA